MRYKGERWTWEAQPVEQGDAMPGTEFCRGARLPNGGIVMGTNNADTHVGVLYEDRDFVAEYPRERFAELFGQNQ